MPGIIPMKLIKCGSSQTRIAQACDRCRSKKIRCDGVRPCCSQCANVGFECKTSDKLSRRAFPRGYTESLEERVRSLEREVRELKDLLDAKDEQLDMLSRIHSFSPYSPPASSASGNMPRSRKTPESLSSEGSGRSGSADAAVEGEIITVTEPAGLIRVEGGDGLHIGASSSGRAFVDLLKQRIGDSGKSTDEFDVDPFFRGQKIPAIMEVDVPQGSIRAPPTLLSDQLLQCYFQEYHQLFPILHRPTFLGLYKKLVNDDGAAASTLSDHEVAQLFLVFATAHQQIESRREADQQVFDIQWQRALNAVLGDNSISTLQCLVLAQLYYFARGDYAKLVHYRSLAVGVATRLELNQSQRKFSLGALGGEMRKRAFWCVFALDAFSAAMLGLPKLLNLEDVETELPSDVDDEYISEQGFLPTLPGDSTKISSALALFRLSRVLAHVLDVEYSNTASHEVSYIKLRELEEELDRWKSGLAPHLRMEFVNGSPSTNHVHRSSPLLSFAYHYIRVVINRPVVGSIHLQHSSASLMVMRESSKCIIQILQLLTERRFGFSFCLNKSHVLVLAGFTLMYSAMDSQRDGQLAKDNRKLLHGVLEELQIASPTLARQFRHLVSSAICAPAEGNTSPISEPAVSPTTKYGSPVDTSGRQHARQKSQTNNSPAPPPAPPTAAVSSKLHHRSASASYARKLSNDYDIQPLQSSSNGHSSHHTRMIATPLSTLSRSRSVHRPTDIPVSKPDHHPLQTRHSISYIPPPALEFSWPPIEPPQQLEPTSNPSASPSIAASTTDDWERMLAMIDANHAAHIYGDAGGTLVTPNSSTVSLPTRIQFAQNRASDAFDAALSEGSADVQQPAQQHPQRQESYPEDSLDYLAGPIIPRVGQQLQQQLVDETWM